MARAPRIPKATNAPTPTQDTGTSNGTTIAIVLVWIAMLGAFVGLVALPLDTVSQMVLAAVATLPSAIALTIALVLRRATQRQYWQSDQLHTAILDLRHMLDQNSNGPDPVSPIAQSKIDAIAAAQEQTDTRLSLFFSRRGRVDTAITLPLADEREPLLALDDGARSDAPAPSAAELIRALHFPEDENDADGFDALRKALADSRTSNLIRAAQEVLTHLAQEGIYMDDLRPDRARPEFWRAFAAGTRGTLIAPLGGIRDRSCLALTAARMRSNADFKATAHLFLREFDRVFAVFEKEADDAQIAALSETRSARAFMLLGRVSGVFSR